MDGGGCLDQPLMRPRPIAAEAIGAPVDEPSSPRAENRLHRNLINRVTVLADYRHSFRRFGARIVRSLSPSGSAMAIATVLLAGAVGYSVVAGGHLANIGTWAKTARDEVANAVGLRIAAVSISGSKEVSREEILTTAGVSGHVSLLFLDAAAARTRLLANPWIADAAVLKLYPDRLQISVTERQAFALWQKNGRVSVIAADGTVLEPYIEDRYLDLPLVVGRGAEIQANDFFAILGRFAAIRAQLRASVLVAERRWDLWLKNGVEIRLPETKVEQALELLTKLDRDKQLLSRDIVAVDLRLPDRVSVRLSDGAALAREEALKDKKKKKGGDA
jgi:cell division protein FtsQ